MGATTIELGRVALETYTASKALQRADRSTRLYREHDLGGLVQLGRKGLEAYAAKLKAADGRHLEANLEIVREAWRLAAGVDEYRFSLATTKAQAAVDSARHADTHGRNSSGRCTECGRFGNHELSCAFA